MVALAVLTASLALSGAPCTHGQLRLRVGPGDGAAGTTSFPLTFVNRSARACTLFGYPGVSSVTRRHRQIGSPALRDPGTPARVVRLRAHGGAATAVYGQVDTGVLPRARCRPVRAWGLRVFAPGQTRASFVRLTHMACGRPGAGDSRVRAVAPGRDAA